MKVNITIPVFNEEAQIEQSVSKLVSYIRRLDTLEYHIVIADNGSTDDTERIGRWLAERYPDVRYERLKEKGRGRALRHVWLNSDADILSYMDVDLSTDLSSLPMLTSAIANYGFDLAIGSRLLPDSRVCRGIVRECLSRTYNWLLKNSLLVSFADAQCGFKAIHKRACAEILPRVRNQSWFFDTELLVIAQTMGYQIAEIPVKWTDDPDSRVKILSTVIEDLRGIRSLRRRILNREFGRRRERADPSSSIHCPHALFQARNDAV